MKTINSFRSKLLTLTLALMASVSTFAYEFEYVNDFHINGFAYKVLPSNTMFPYGSAALIEIADCNKDVVIPEFVSDGNTEYRIITIGIGSVVFTNDASSVVESITIPKTTNIINKNVLAGCPNLKTVVVDSENPYFDSRENCNAIITTSQNPYFTPNTLIAGCKTTLIPNSVVEIGENAFYDCESLETITIPNSVTKIGKSAFNVCSTLSSITLSENLTEIGNWAFDDCNNLKEVICYAPQPPTISKYTFSDISPTVYVPENTVTIYQNAPYWMTFDIQPIQPSYKSQWCDTWNVFVENGSVYPPHEETYRYQLAQDTVIGDYTYTAVVSKAINDAFDAPRYVAAVRFTDDRKVYIYYDNAEYLLYDFDVQEGEELEVFAGINNYTSEIKTYKCTVTGVEQYACVGCPATITLQVHNHPNDFREFYRETQWIEGVGDINGFLNGINHYVEMDGGGSEYLLCAYKGDELKHTGPLYEEYGCEYNAGPFNEKLLGTWRVVGGNEIISISDSIIVFIGLTQKYTASATQLTVERLWIPEEESYRWANCNYTLSNDTLWIDNFMPLLVATYPPTFGPITLVKVKHEDLFPTLWGLQQTICSGYYGEEGDEWTSGLTGPSQEITMMDGKPYLQWGSWYLREENDKILVYSEIQKKDLVLYDFTLELGDTLTTLNLVTPEFLEYEGIVGIVDYPLSDDDYTYPIDTLVVTELSKETLLDGKEYTRWKFSDGTVYVEGIGSMSETFFHHIADHLPVPVSYLGSYLVCVSKNNKLLYQMDDAEMERLGAECLCDYDRGPRKDNAKDGQIGGRPTPTQWNQLEVVLRQMDNNHTILQAETFSYTLENDSIVANDKIFYQLARQSTKDTATTKSVVGALHFGKDEDNRVYFLRDGVEYILYDFTAEIGDTVEIFAGINNYPQETTYTHVVVDKDTTEDGACRMFLEVVFPDETNATAENAEKVWLAGLGSVDGIVHNAAKRTSNAHAAPSRSASSETESSVMLCAWREDSCLYTTNHPDYETFGCVYNQDPTSVEDISTSQSSYQKIIREGQFLILHNGKTYSVMGIEL